jgi:uncharacterized protein (UPF0332 family)
MAYHDDLLDQALHLARRDPKRPKQANLRRAVSTAYYALFHLLIADAVTYWRLERQRSSLARAFEHRRMKEACRRCNSPNVALRAVAEAFVELQQSRHLADYDNSRVWTKVEVMTHIATVRTAFQKWGKVKDQTDAQDFLLSLFVFERR